MAGARKEKQNSEQKSENVFRLTQWQLIWRKFRKHKVAVVSGYVIAIIAILAIFAQFISPYGTQDKEKQQFQPPQPLHFIDENGFRLRPFVYHMEPKRNPLTMDMNYIMDKSIKYNVRFFVQGVKYKLWGLIPTNLHLYGVDGGGSIHLFGTDDLGRDVLSRILYGAQISLSVGLVGIFLAFLLGCILGGVSGYFGGTVDTVIQRMIEFLICIPTIPLWLALGAALPPDWPPIRVYFGITVILAIVGWTGLARVVRGKLLELRSEDYVRAAEFMGASELRIIVRHMLPGMTSYLIVSLTLSIPSMILGETALSFLGLGLRPPVVSWGVMLQAAQNVQVLYLHPWILIPALFVIAVVLAFNGFGDGLRDAADPYTR
jgi:peptide/nickel transport system permease protein